MESDTAVAPEPSAAGPAPEGLPSDDDERLMLLVEAAGALIRPDKPDAVIPHILTVAMRVIAADAYALWIYDADPGEWHIASASGLSEHYLEQAAIALSPATPVLSETLVVPDVFTEAMLIDRQEGYRLEGIASIMVVPLRIDGQNHGTLTFYFRERHAPDEREIRIAEALANMAAATIEATSLRAEQRQATARLAESNNRLEILVQASAMLSEPLGLQDGAGAARSSPLSRLAALLVPSLGDICVLDLFDPQGEPLRVELATTPDVDKRLLAQSHLRDWRVVPGEDETVGMRLGRGEGVRIEQVDDRWLRACAPSDAQREIAAAIGARSVMMAPLKARGLVLGALSLISLGERSYTAADYQWIESLARRTAAAIDNERLFNDAQTTAEQLRDANRAKDEFLGLVSHELRTPLTVIRGNAGTLARHMHRMAPDELDASLHDIISESERLNRIVENLLLLARFEQGQGPEREPLLIVRVVEKIIARRRRLSPQRRFRIIERSEPRPVSFPEGYLEQVLENLISNAEKYSPRDKAITIEIARDPDRVRFEVRDRGAGIRDEDAQHLFDPFFRGEHTSAEAAGLGIGLAVCRRLVEAQGGEIWARSRPGGGSVFGFSLPIISDE